MKQPNELDPGSNVIVTYDGGEAMNAQQVKNALNKRAASFVRWLFPEGKKEGNNWLVGSLEGVSGKSLSICIAGARVGVFRDFATDEGGDNLVELYVQTRDAVFKEALDRCREWLGGSVSSHLKSSAGLLKVRDDFNSSAAVPSIPDSVLKTWKEGIDHFVCHPEKAAELATWRGWTTDFVLEAIEAELISMPLYGAKRGFAFQVRAPERINNQLAAKQIGYHVRIQLKPNDSKASWRFVPNETEHGQSIPPLPFMIGDFHGARLLVITEGQWDALTFGQAAGWLGTGGGWPRGVCVIGIPGVSGVGVFLQYYRAFWPAAANCLIVADSDEAGSRWYSGKDSFTAKLTKLCRKVAVVDCAPVKDFNELYRKTKVGPVDISRLLATHQMPLEGLFNE